MRPRILMFDNFRMLLAGKETIKVKGQRSVELSVRTSVFGPVVTDVVDKSEYRGPPLALRWSAIDSELQDTTLNAFRLLGNASDWTGFRAALAHVVAPSQNFLFADGTTGDIGYALSGKVPTRANPAHTGQVPVPGTSSTAYAWSGFISAQQLPRSLAPPEGFIVSANNRVSPANYPLLITHDWASGSNGYRAKRITQLITDKISASAKVSPEDMKAIQLDTVSELARDLKPLLETLPQSALSADGVKWIQQLIAWDLAMVSIYPPSSRLPECCLGR
jgi:penicillin amidase